jgi:hypothetical protein
MAMIDQTSMITVEELFAKFSEEMTRRTTTYPVPSPHFDPRTATPEQLAHFGFPPKPDRKTNPQVYDLWIKLFSPPLSFVGVDKTFPLASIDQEFDVFDSPSPLPTFSTRYESSSNWSGGYITSRDGQMFTELYGSWQVPTSSVPTGATGAVSNYRSSAWIGLDGQRSYLNSSLPQIGTVQYIDASGTQMVPKASTWFQWWQPHVIRPPVTLPLPVEPGDLITSSLIVLDETHVQFLIKNQTTGVLLLPFIVKAPQVNLKNPPTVKQLKIAGATAEWILERPSEIIITVADGSIYLRRGPLRDLPDYGTEVFDNCLAVSASKPGEPGRTQILAGARLIDMFKLENNPNRTTFISTAKPEGDQTITTSFI